MPFYDYNCDQCGSFTENRPMAEFAKPILCPSCGVDAPRAMLSAPRVGGRRVSNDTALKRLAASTKADAGVRTHHPGCGCCAGFTVGKFTADGESL